MPLYYNILKGLDDARATTAQWKIELESSLYTTVVSSTEQKQYDEMYGQAHKLLEEMEKILLKKSAEMRR